MANTLIPIPTAADGAPEVLPWATGGAVLEPNAAQEYTGWQPQGIGPPPDCRIENYARNRQAVLNARAIQSALMVEYAQATILLTGTDPGVNERRVTIGGINLDNTDSGVTTPADAFCAIINAHPVVGPLVLAELTGAAGEFTVRGREPGVGLVLTVAVLAGAGTIAVTSAAETPVIRPDSATLGLDVVIGSTKADDSGPAGDARVTLRKGKGGAFRAGKATGAQWDDANTGIDSIGLGRDCTASGLRSVAIGQSADATTDDAVAIGPASTASGGSSLAMMGGLASGLRAVAVGSGSEATDPDCIAVGASAHSHVDSSIAIGVTANAALDYSIAIGRASHVSAIGGVAIGDGATTAGEWSTAIGPGASAAGLRTVAIGDASTDAAAVDSAAIGTGSAIGADGDHAFAAAQGTANGTNAVAFGEHCNATGVGAFAAGVAALAAPLNANGDGSVATGGLLSATLTSDAVIADAQLARAHGTAVAAHGVRSEATGFAAKATQVGERARSSFGWNPTGNVTQVGTAQFGDLHLTAETVGVQTRTMTHDGGAAPGAATTWTPDVDSAYIVDLFMIARRYAGGVANVASAWRATMVVRRTAAGVVTLDVGTGPVPPIYETIGGRFTLSAAVNGASTGIDLTAGGTVLGETVRFSARLEYAKVASV